MQIYRHTDVQIYRYTILIVCVFFPPVFCVSLGFCCCLCLCFGTGVIDLVVGNSIYLREKERQSFFCLIYTFHDGQQLFWYFILGYLDLQHDIRFLISFSQLDFDRDRGNPSFVYIYTVHDGQLLVLYFILLQSFFCLIYTFLDGQLLFL